MTAADRQRVVDCAGKPLAVGARVVYGGALFDALATVTEVTEYDVDYDDDLQRPRLSPPTVRFRFDSGRVDETPTYDVTEVTWADYPDGPEVYVFEAGDLVVVER